MEDVSDLAFRLTCRDYGAGLAYTEMCHSHAIIAGRMDRARTSEKERPVGIQVAGKDVPQIVEAAKSIEKTADLIDINLGCPGPNVVSNGYGSALLKEVELISQIVSSLVKAVKIPVTAKMRAGFDSDADAVKIAQAIERAGGAAVTVHPRTRAQGYSGKADWVVIAAVKKAVKIPVIGNGDIRSGKDALEMMRTTGCDGVMIGRAAIGDPLIFKRITEYLAHGGTRPEVPSTIEERIEAFLKYVDYAKKLDLFDRGRILRQSQHVTRSFEGSAAFRNSLSPVRDTDQLVNITIDFLRSQNQTRPFPSSRAQSIPA